MKLWGLTGGVGMGKSTAAQILRDRGAQVVDADALAHQLVEPGQLALTQIQAAFGNHIVGPDGRLRRAVLADLIFDNAAARQKLESILHPPIRQLWLARVERWRRENRPLAVVVIPLLFETQAEAHFDNILCVACSAAAQRERLLARGWTPAQIQRRNAAQWAVEQKIARSDWVIWTEGSLETHVQQIERVLAGL